MGKKLKINLLIIVFIIVILTTGGVVAAFTLGENIALSAIRYGAGTADDPYRIYNSSQLTNLQEISQGIHNDDYTKNKHYKLCRNVNLNSSCGHFAEDAESNFWGVFDGGGYTVNAGGNLLFYYIRKGAKVKNLNVNIDLKPTIKVATDEKNITCGLAVSSRGTIENCHITGNIDVKGYKFGRYLSDTSISGICNNNYGLIKDCSFNGNITGVKGDIKRYLAIRCVGGIAAQGDGVIENCTFNGNIELYANSMIERIGGISFKNTLKNCTFNGDIYFNRGYNNKNNKWYGLHTYIYGLSPSCEGCTFNGDIISTNRRAPEKMIISVENSDFVHNGEIRHTDTQ